MQHHGLKAMQAALRRIQSEANACTTEAGHVKPSCRYRYQTLVRQGVEYKHAIFTWEKLFSQVNGSTITTDGQSVKNVILKYS